eukprot:164612-Chlamydomonas_euryale.AAC.4
MGGRFVCVRVSCMVIGLCGQARHAPQHPRGIHGTNVSPPPAAPPPRPAPVPAPAIACSEGR